MLRILQQPASASCNTRPPYIDLIPRVDMEDSKKKKKSHHPLITELFELRDVRKPKFHCTWKFLLVLAGRSLPRYGLNDNLKKSHHLPVDIKSTWRLKNNAFYSQLSLFSSCISYENTPATVTTSISRTIISTFALVVTSNTNPNRGMGWLKIAQKNATTGYKIFSAKPN